MKRSVLSYMFQHWSQLPVSIREEAGLMHIYDVQYVTHRRIQVTPTPTPHCCCHRCSSCSGSRGNVFILFKGQFIEKQNQSGDDEQMVHNVKCS